MIPRKQQLLHSHRRKTRRSLAAALVILVALGVFVAWWLAPLLLFVGWLIHEARFADHLFYSPRTDYHYEMPPDAASQRVSLIAGRLRLSASRSPGETLFLELELRSTWLGWWFDPSVLIGDDRQEFERGLRGRRYVNLSGQAAAVDAGDLHIAGRFCKLSTDATLYSFRNPDYTAQRVLVLAPHADDAELAAFGLYSRASDAVIVTVTRGEVEAAAYRRLGLSKEQAAELKGRLRSWDSLAIPLWGGVAQSRCFQLGYHCLQLAAMLGEPEMVFASRESAETDVRVARRHNPLSLPGDVDGLPKGANLCADFLTLCEHYRPEVIVTPHPELDPHPDHIATTRALWQALRHARWRPTTVLLYANHLHDNDRWPMGPAGGGIALPPARVRLPADGLWSPLLSSQVQLDKAMSLGMQHDLQGPLSGKRRLRRMIQYALLGRRWPSTGDNEFFRKAIRRHELFWVRRFDAGASRAE